MSLHDTAKLIASIFTYNFQVRNNHDQRPCYPSLQHVILVVVFMRLKNIAKLVVQKNAMPIFVCILCYQNSNGIVSYYNILNVHHRVLGKKNSHHLQENRGARQSAASGRVTPTLWCG